MPWRKWVALTFGLFVHSTSTVWLGTRRRRGKTWARLLQRRSPRTSYDWCPCRTAALTSASHGMKRSRLTRRFPWQCAEKAKNKVNLLPWFSAVESHQITLSGNGNENQVITHAHFLTLGSLLGCWVHRPPARLAFEHSTNRIRHKSSTFAIYLFCSPEKGWVSEWTAKLVASVNGLIQHVPPGAECAHQQVP